MKTMNRRTLILLAAAGLIAAALTPILAPAQDKAQQAVPDKQQIGPGPLADLGLTPDQVKALEAFRQARAGERRAFRENMAKLGDEMRQLRQDPQASQGKIDALIDKRAGLMAQHEKDAFRARADRNKIFTPEQLGKLKAMRTRLAGRGPLAGMGRGWGRGGRSFGPRAGFRSMGRWRALRHRNFLDRWLW